MFAIRLCLVELQGWEDDGARDEELVSKIMQ
jgi:hypothetical protein